MCQTQLYLKTWEKFVSGYNHVINVTCLIPSTREKQVVSSYASMLAPAAKDIHIPFCSWQQQWEEIVFSFKYLSQNWGEDKIPQSVTSEVLPSSSAVLLPGLESPVWLWSVRLAEGKDCHQTVLGTHSDGDLYCWQTSHFQCCLPTDLDLMEVNFDYIKSCYYCLFCILFFPPPFLLVFAFSTSLKWEERN